MMAIKRSHSTVVVLGAWNPAIIEPAWLHKHKVLDEEPPKELRWTVTLLPGAGGVRFETGGMTWLADAARLEIKGKDWRDCGVYAARVLGLLPHTPIHAVGTNFIFTCDIPEWPTEYLPRLSDLTLGEGNQPREFKQEQWSGVRELDDKTRMQVAVAARLNEGIMVSVNLHRNVRSAEDARVVAGGWSQDRDVAEGVLIELFKVQLS